MNLQRYGAWSPTAFDAPQYLEDREGWIVAPVILTRDSGPLERSNWETVRRDILAADAGEDVETHRFGHWGPGWFEIVLIRPGSPAEAVAREWAASLEGYAVADEEALAREELEEAGQSWEDWGRSDWIRALEREHAGLDLSEVQDAALDTLWELAEGMTEHGGDGPRFYVAAAARRVSRADVLAAGAAEVDA